MKKTLFSFVMLLFVACHFKNEKSKYVADTFKDTTSLVWRDTLIDLGNVKAESNVPFVFHCKNIGTIPLLFQKMESTCGCTVLDKKINIPILPSKEDSIVGHLNTSQVKGIVERKIYVLANTKQQFHVLRVKAYVEQ